MGADAAFFAKGRVTFQQADICALQGGDVMKWIRSNSRISRRKESNVLWIDKVTVIKISFAS